LPAYRLFATTAAIGIVAGGLLAVTAQLDGRHHSALVGELLAVFSAAVLVTSIIRLRD
jgi:type IV secretory pathway VirB2 component (pilin)